ncbi:NAD(P)H-binding protein [Streptomyces sp. NRRL B-1677]|uniref:NAD(P)-dependent oxidoreductase n=1 Tax=Streptomyces sp. NRRL B-1677 TaxID=2682966 RepID=UPI001892AAC6|nr:NAD(P)H-binding protein [Streptomyces sp. NRRL B-1677]MBF6045237.1 NAD(P)H-binding protein [Streptomyces sp. NRRL B-1677]
MDAQSSRIIVFGAGGRVGRAAVAEARRRGHEVTAVGRADGKVTDPEAVARLAAGHDAAIVAVYDPGVPAGEFFPAVARALAEGLPAAGVKRLVSVGLASVLPTASGDLLMDTPGYPQEWREFYVGHGAGTEALRTAAPEALDWVVLSPAGDFDHEGAPSGGYALAPAAAGSRITPGDFARALLDEAGVPTLHRTHAGVSAA